MEEKWVQAIGNAVVDLGFEVKISYLPMMVIIDLDTEYIVSRSRVYIGRNSKEEGMYNIRVTEAEGEDIAQIEEYEGIAEEQMVEYVKGIISGYFTDEIE